MCRHIYKSLHGQGKVAVRVLWLINVVDPRMFPQLVKSKELATDAKPTAKKTGGSFLPADAGDRKSPPLLGQAARAACSTEGLSADADVAGGTAPALRGGCLSTSPTAPEQPSTTVAAGAHVTDDDFVTIGDPCRVNIYHAWQRMRIRYHHEHVLVERNITNR